jgi:hypothetical protein
MMNKLEQTLQISKQEDVEAEVLNLADRLDFLDIQILRKFYSTGEEFPHDTSPFCFPILFRELRIQNHLKIGLEALRKRMEILVGAGLLEKVKDSNPCSYFPVKGKEKFVKAVIMKFFLINGLTKFL